MIEFVNKLTSMFEDEIKDIKFPFSDTEHSTTSGDCLFLYLLVRYLKPTNILEIGTFVGNTLSALILACEKNNKPYKIHTIDLEDNLKLEKNLLKNVVIHHGHSRDVLKSIDENLDFIFSDAALDKSTAKLLSKIINQNTFFATHDFVPPYDKGITSVYHIINSTILRNNYLIVPNYRSNWIYHSKKYSSIHDTFSSKYIRNNNFETINGHNEYNINLCIAIICPEDILENMKLDKRNYKISKKIISHKQINLKFQNDHILIKNNLYCYNKFDKEIIVMCKFIDKLPYVYKIFKRRNNYINLLR